MPVLTLYSRPECHLCEAVHTELLALVRDRAELRVVDVDGSPALERRYGLRIPVLVAGDTELSGYPLDRRRVAAYLDSL